MLLKLMLWCAFQVMASLRVEQGKPDEAMAFLQQSMALWYDDQPPSDADRQMSDADGQAPDERQTPSYEFRLETVKLLLELDDTINTAYDVSCFAPPFRIDLSIY